MVDARGDEIWSSELDTYGSLQQDSSGPNRCPFRFAGQYEDQETGISYNRFRYYDPNSGQFISQDPIGLVGGLELYGHLPDPTTWIDPLGLTKGPHLNTNGATGNFGVYEITIHGELHKIGKADLSRVTQTSKLPTRLHQQLRKLRQIHGDENVKGKVLPGSYKTTKDAKDAETARLQAHFDRTGEVPDGNKRSFKPKRSTCQGTS
jgi:RHS repeat-associated protein